MTTPSNYLRFERARDEERGVTQVWLVISRSREIVLGRVRWFGRWRQYVFCPEPDTVFNTACLSDVQSVIRGLMAERRAR